MTSIGEIVNQVIEQLSDGLSLLTMLILKHKAANSAIPANLAPGVNGVVQACTALVTIARQIAQADYAQYPKIRDAMLSAADAVEVASKNIIDVVQKKDEPATQWTNLNDSVRVISSKTTLLLQLVYGAELKRLLEASERALEALALSEQRLSTVRANPQEFANAAGDAGTKVGILGAFARARATEEQVPHMKAVLMVIADGLDKHADVLIQNANGVLGNLDDPEKARAYNAEVEATRATIASLVNPLRGDAALRQLMAAANEGMLAETADAIARMLRELQSAAAECVAAPQDAPKSAHLKSLLEQLSEAARTMAIMSNNEDVQSVKRHLDQLIARLLPVGDGMIDTNGLLVACQDLAGSLAGLVGDVRVDNWTEIGNNPAAAPHLATALSLLKTSAAQRTGSRKEYAMADANTIAEQLAKLVAIHAHDYEAEERARIEAQEKERLRLEAEAAARRLRELEEAARRLKEEEEAERRRLEAQEAERRAHEEAERLRRAQEEADRRLAAAAAAERVRLQAEADEARRLAEEQARLEAAAKARAEAERLARAEAERLRKEAERAARAALPKISEQTSLFGIASAIEAHISGMMSKEHEGLLAGARSIADLLRQLSDAAKAGNGSEVIRTARLVSDKLKEIIAYLQRLAATPGCPPHVQETLTRCASALQNYSVQIKILASVTATSRTAGEANQMVALARGVGASITDSMSTIDASEIELKERKMRAARC